VAVNNRVKQFWKFQLRHFCGFDDSNKEEFESLKKKQFKNAGNAEFFDNVYRKFLEIVPSSSTMLQARQGIFKSRVFGMRTNEGHLMLKRRVNRGAIDHFFFSVFEMGLRQELRLLENALLGEATGRAQDIFFAQLLLPKPSPKKSLCTVAGSFRLAGRDDLAEVIRCCHDQLKGEHHGLIQLLMDLAQMSGDLIEFSSDPNILKILGAVSVGTSKNRLASDWYQSKKNRETSICRVGDGQACVLLSAENLSIGPLYFDYCYSQAGKYPSTNLQSKSSSLSRRLHQLPIEDKESKWGGVEICVQSMREPIVVDSNLFGALVNPRKTLAEDQMLQFPDLGSLDPIGDFMKRDIKGLKVELSEVVLIPKKKAESETLSQLMDRVNRQIAQLVQQRCYRPQQLFAWEEELAVFYSSPYPETELQKATAFLDHALLPCERGDSWFEMKLEKLDHNPCDDTTENSIANAIYALIGISSTTFASSTTPQGIPCFLLDPGSRIFAVSKQLSRRVLGLCADCGNLYFHLVWLHGQFPSESIAHQTIVFGIEDHHREVLRLSASRPSIVALTHSVNTLISKLKRLITVFSDVATSKVKAMERFYKDALHAGIASFTIERYVLDFSLSPLVQVLRDWMFQASDSLEYFESEFLIPLQPGINLQYSSENYFSLHLPSFFRSRRYGLNAKQVGEKLVHCGSTLRYIRNLPNSTTIIQLMTDVPELPFLKSPPLPLHFFDIEKACEYSEARVVRLRFELEKYSRDVEQACNDQAARTMNQQAEELQASRSVHDQLLLKLQDEEDKQLKELHQAKHEEFMELKNQADNAVAVKKQANENRIQHEIENPDRDLLSVSDKDREEAETFLRRRYEALEAEQDIMSQQLQEENIKLKHDVDGLAAENQLRSAALSSKVQHTSVKVSGSLGTESEDMRVMTRSHETSTVFEEDALPFKPSVRISHVPGGKSTVFDEVHENDAAILITEEPVEVVSEVTTVDTSNAFDEVYENDATILITEEPAEVVSEVTTVDTSNAFDEVHENDAAILITEEPVEVVSEVATVDTSNAFDEVYENDAAILITEEPVEVVSEITTVDTRTAFGELSTNDTEKAEIIEEPMIMALKETSVDTSTWSASEPIIAILNPMEVEDKQEEILPKTGPIKSEPRKPVSSWDDAFPTTRENIEKPIVESESEMIPCQPFESCAPFEVALEVGMIDSLLAQCTLVDAAMLVMLKCHSPLFQHMQNVKDILLLGKGDLFHSVVATLLEKQLKVHKVPESEFTGAGLTQDDFGFTLKYTDGEDDGAIVRVSPEILIEWPLVTFITETSDYVEIHSFLLRIKQINSLLRSIWKTSGQLSNVFLVLSWHQIRHFFVNLEEYIMSQLHDNLWQEMVLTIRESKNSAKELKDAHTRFMKLARRACFLDESKSSKSVLNILNRMFRSVLQMHAGPTCSFQKEFETFSKLQDFLQRALGLYATMDSSAFYTGGYSGLMVRMDFNEYFTKTESRNPR